MTRCPVECLAQPGGARSVLAAVIVAGLLAAGSTSGPPGMGKAEGEPQRMESFDLPKAEASRTVSVTNAGPALARILVQTPRAAVKETGPKETVARFGEVYAFAPAFFAVHREEPTQIRFWNLQPDDPHTFMLVDPRLNVLLNVPLPPLEETALVFTCHQEGLFNFYGARHPPARRGQLLVLPPNAP